MRRVTCWMGMSLDGYIVGPDGGFDFSAPDEELFRFAIDEIRKIGVYVLGRRLYESMLYWETAAQDPSLDDARREWVSLWNPLPKVVFSTTLQRSEEHTSELQSRQYLVCRLLLEKKNTKYIIRNPY